MNESLAKQIAKLSKGEQAALSQYIEKQYAIDLKESAVFRDDIKDRTIAIVAMNFVSPRFIVQEHYNWIELNMDATDINDLAALVTIEFELSYINPDAIVKWETIKDIVNYIENALEERL